MSYPSVTVSVACSIIVTRAHDVPGNKLFGGRQALEQVPSMWQPASGHSRAPTRCAGQEQGWAGTYRATLDSRTRASVHPGFSPRVELWAHLFSSLSLSPPTFTEKTSSSRGKRRLSQWTNG